MAKYIGPKCKICRREGEKLFLKGDRCNTPKCSIVKRNYPPGIHGQTAGKSSSDYNFHLREKQKAKRIYGLLERQFKNYFTKASKGEGVTGDNLLQLLESRLDNVVFRLGFVKSRSQARGIVNHGHVWVNDKVVNIPSYQVKLGEVVKIKEKSSKKKYFVNLAKTKTGDTIPKWLKADSKSLQGEVISMPTAEDLDQRINTQMIVEYYSK